MGKEQIGWRREKRNILKDKVKGEVDKVAIGKKGPDYRAIEETRPYTVYKRQERWGRSRNMH